MKRSAAHSVDLEIFRNLFVSIADEMGVVPGKFGGVTVNEAFT